MKNVVVATDFSKRGALAVARGAAIADGAGAQLTERNKCDLIAASTHARRSLARLLIGSVSAELLRHGSTDLLLAPRLASASSALSGL